MPENGEISISRARHNRQPPPTKIDSDAAVGIFSSQISYGHRAIRKPNIDPHSKLITLNNTTPHQLTPDTNHKRTVSHSANIIL